MSLQMVTVTGTLKHLDGTPQIGRVEFALPYTLIDPAGHVLWSDRAVVAELDDTGSFSTSLPATDSAGVSPTNWTYTVTIATDGNSDAPFQCLLPSTPDSVHLDQLVRVDVPPTVGVWVPVSALGVTVATLGDDGLVPVDQLPAGSGGGVAAVAAANGTIAVTGTATNPLIGIGTGIPESAITGLTTDLSTLSSGVSSASSAASAAQSTATAAGSAAAAAQSTANGAASTAAAAYVKPGPGIPKTDLAGAVQGSLDLADSALQAIPADVTTDVHPVFPLAAYGYHSGSCAPEAIRSVSTMNNEQWFARIWVPAGKTVAKVGCFAIRSAGTVGAGGLNGFAIYSDAGALLWSSATDDTLWTAVGERSKTVTPNIAAQTTGTWYRVAMSVQGYSTPPGTQYANLGDSAALSDAGSNRSRFRSTAATTWPATINPATELGTTTGYLVPLFLG